MDGKEDRKQTVIGEDVEINGSIKCANGIEIAGRLTGDLTCSGKAVIAASANLKGNMNVDSVSVLGQINGNIVAKDRIEFKSSARITGDIRAKRLTVEDGVTFVGKSEVNPAGTSGAAAKSETETRPPANEAENAKGKNAMFGKK